MQTLLSPDSIDDELSIQAICERICDRRAGVRTRKARNTAVANLVRIIPATLKLGNQRGFQNMSLRELSAETGLSMGALYAHFGSKDALLLMILGEVNFAVHHILVPVNAKLLPPKEHLHWLLHRHVQMTTVMHPFFFFAFMEARHFHKAARRLAQDGELYTERLIADAVAALRPDDSETDHLFAASLIKPMLQDWYVKPWKYKRRSISAVSFTAQLTTWIDAMLAG